MCGQYSMICTPVDHLILSYSFSVVEYEVKRIVPRLDNASNPQRGLRLLQVSKEIESIVGRLITLQI